MKLDNQIIADWVTPGATVLDLGCGNGELLTLLKETKNVRGQGLEIDEQCIYRCVTAGLSVIHDDIDSGLPDYRDQAFDYVVLNQSLQQVKQVDKVFGEARRVGKKVVIGFPNFVSWRARLQLVIKGRVPVTPSLPYQWYDSPNLHFLGIQDFIDYAQERQVVIERSAFISRNRQVTWRPNLFAEAGLFLIQGGGK